MKAAGTETRTTGREISALLNPRPLALIGACGAQGEAGFATVAWITPVSHHPPLLAFALRAHSHTMELLRKTGAFSVCTLATNDRSRELVALCGNNSGHSVDKAKLVPHRLIATSPAQQVPIANEALAWLACQVKSVKETGDHLLVIGSVFEAYTRSATDEQGRIIATDTLLAVQHDLFATANLLKD